MLDLTGMAAPSYRGRVVDDQLVELPFGGFSGAPNAARRSSIEGTPHGAVHNAVGGYLKNAAGQPVDRNGNVIPFNQRILGDMANLRQAAHDPIFFAHHANIDRLWEIWRSPADSAHVQSEPWSESDFTAPEFEFFDVASTLPYRVKVDKTRNVRDLNYRYASPGEGPMEGPSMMMVIAQRAEPDGAQLGTHSLNVAPTKPWSPCKPHTVRLPRNQASARACRNSSL